MKLASSFLLYVTATACVAGLLSTLLPSPYGVNGFFACLLVAIVAGVACEAFDQASR